MIAALLIGIPAASARAQEPPRLWLAPLPPQEPQNPHGATDYYDLFAHAEGWSRTAARARVFKVYPEMIEHASDERLRAVFAGLASAGLDLAVESPALAHAFGCGPPGTEGAPWVIASFARIKSLGGVARYFAMNGPWVAGTAGPAVASCPHGMAEVAEDLAGTVRGVRSIFPDIAVGDIEPVGLREHYPDWARLSAWLAELGRVLGSPPAFLHLDVTWDADGWRLALPGIAADARAAGVRLGCIYIGTGRELSDAEDANAVAEHAVAFETALGGAPADVVFQTWFAHPTRVLPELDPLSLTGQALSYLRSAAMFADDGATIQLRSGRMPLLKRSVSLQRAPDKRSDLHNIVVEGVVPADARSALLALRVNTECACDGDRGAEVTVARARLSQPDRRPAALLWGERSEVPRHWAGVLISSDADRAVLSLRTGRTLVLNGTAISVAAGRPFTLTYDWFVDAASEGGGNLALIFQGDNGQELLRRPVPFAPAWVTTRVMTTDAEGRVPAPAPGSRVVFGGDAVYKPATFTSPRIGRPD